MESQINLNPFSKLLYLIFLDLNQPFTFDECLVFVQSFYPACTKKTLQTRIKEMLRKRYLKKQRVQRKTVYKCLVSKESVLSQQTHPDSIYQSNFFLCGL